MPDSSPDRLRAIVAHDMVADTNGFDRDSLELDALAGDVARLAYPGLVYTSGWYPAETDAAESLLTFDRPCVPLIDVVHQQHSARLLPPLT